MVEEVPVQIGRKTDEGGFEQSSPAFDPAALGQAVAGVIRYHMAVIDREDRLEAGSGEWLGSFLGDRVARDEAVRESILRALQLAADRDNFALLEALATGVSRSTDDLMQAGGFTRLVLAERVADLVSAGLAAKVPEADQVVGTDGGRALVEMIRRAIAAGSESLEEPA